MDRRTFLVTGATDGIGYETALALARSGCEVYVHGRTEDKARIACDRLKRAGAAKVYPAGADFLRLFEVRSLAIHARDEWQLDGVIHNAGVIFPERVLTEDGWEGTWQVNHLAGFLLQNLLKPCLKPGARVVWVSSMLHTRGRIPWDDLERARGYDPIAAYSASKLANVLTAFRLGRNKPSALTSVALHPGVVGTKLLNQSFGMGGIAPSDGARTSVYAALHPDLEGTTGVWLESSRVGASSTDSRDKALQDRLWDWSNQALGLS